jgi:hypothetical protein
VADTTNRNPEIFTVKENGPLAKPHLSFGRNSDFAAKIGLSHEHFNSGLNSEEAAKRFETYCTNELALKQNRAEIVSFLLNY